MSLFIACALTVLIEVPFLALFGFRTRYDLTVTVCANVISNLTMNLVLHALPAVTIWTLLIAELAVLFAEYGIYRLAFGKRKRLFLLTLSANVLSCALGLLLFR